MIQIYSSKLIEPLSLAVLEVTASVQIIVMAKEKEMNEQDIYWIDIIIRILLLSDIMQPCQLILQRKPFYSGFLI